MPRFRTHVRLLGIVCWLLISVSCAEPVPSPPPPPVETPAAPALTPPCTFKDEAFRGGVEPPAVISRVKPDFRGILLPSGERHVILEAYLDTEGRVAEACILRGLGAEIDVRVLDAVRRWRFQPARVKAGIVVEGERIRPGTVVPVIMTLSVRVSSN
jgi:TonB family protein